MAFEQRSLDDYIDVAQRIADFREKYPEGTLDTIVLDGNLPFKIVQAEGFEKDGSVIQQTFVVVVAAAHRTPTDPRPGTGMAWEIFPGRTPYTRGSELQNAETSAWGRAIIAVGASDSKRGIASREEVRNRQAEDADRLIADARARRRADPEVDAHGAATVAEQTRMTTGPEPGVERLGTTPVDDPWYDNPAPLADLTNPEDRHGTATADQIRTLQAKFT